MNVTWEPSAVRLLKQRDRFTERAIKHDFESTVAEGPEADGRTIAFDATNRGFLTAVAEERYSVVWYLEGDAAAVEAVVPTTRFSSQPQELKQRVQSVIDSESLERVLLK